MELYGTENYALLDTGAVTNLISGDLCQKLALSPTEIDRQVTVADGTVAKFLGSVKGVPVSYGSIVSHLEFLVVKNTPFDVIVGSPTLEAL